MHHCMILRKQPSHLQTRVCELPTTVTDTVLKVLFMVLLLRSKFKTARKAIKSILKSAQSPYGLMTQTLRQQIARKFGYC